MAEWRGHDRSVQFEHAFDRLLAVKLERVYEILVPEQVRAIGSDPRVRENSDENRRDLRQGILRAAEGGEHDRQPDGGASRVRARARIQRTREWVIEDEGFSGASLLRPGLERLRDLAAEGHIQAVLIHSPDRLSRKYAYQVLLTEEFARQGVEAVFLKAPRSGAPEDQLMLQFQGRSPNTSGRRFSNDPAAASVTAPRPGKYRSYAARPMATAIFARPAMRRHVMAPKRRSCDWCTTNIRWTV